MALSSFLRLLARPTLLAPAVRVKSIANLDFVALRRAGYRGAIFDKDNCLTIPNQDRLVPQLQRAWDECLRTFDAGHVVIVSNSAGTREDVSGLEGESVSYHLQVPVLFHNIHKPGCRDVILRYYATLTTSSHCFSSSTHLTHNAAESQAIPRLPIKPSELIVVGDRLFTDVLMGNQLGALTIWTQGLWKRELMPMRFFEKGILWALDKVEGRRHRSQNSDISVAPSPQISFVKADLDGLPPSQETPASTGRWILLWKKGYRVYTQAVRWLCSRLVSLRTPTSSIPQREPATPPRSHALGIMHSFQTLAFSFLDKGSKIVANVASRGCLWVYSYGAKKSASLRSAISNVRRGVQGRRTD